MAHQVFVSHATEDLDSASRICKVLEADGIDCWLANRDVEAGTDYAAAILDAIKDSQLVVLVFSRHANASPYVLREIERAIAYDRPVLSLRLDDTAPNASMEYYLNLWQWLDAHAGIEKQRGEIVGAVREQLESIVAKSVNVEDDSGDRSIAEAVTRPKRKRRIWTIAAAVVVLIAVGAGVGIWAAVRYSGAEASSGTLTIASTSGATSSSVAARDSNTWTELSPSGTLPLARNTRSLVLDPSSGRLILFGGSSADSASGDLNDTWAYDPVANTWTNLNPPDPLPAARWGTSMVYVPSIGRLMLFGGASGNTDLNDTWAYDPVANTWTDLNPSGTVPMVRAGHSLVYEPSSGRVFMFGGQTSVQDEDGAVFADLGDIWAYDPAGNTWSKLRPRAPYPVGRYAHSMVYAPSINKLVMFGGWGANGVLNDTWAYDPAANAWTNLTPSGTVPYARYSASMAYDPSTGVALMFGGLISDTKVFNDTWAYDPMANSWKKLSPSGTPPSPRGAHAMSYDPSSGQMIMFGGVRPLSPQAPGQRLNDTWAYAP